MAKNYTFSVNLSSLNVGDICHLSGSMHDHFSGAGHAYAYPDTTFTWQASNVFTYSGTWNSYTVNYTVTLTSNSQTISMSEPSGMQSYGGWLEASVKVYKVDSPWVAAQKAYKKQNGAWVEITDMSEVFDPNVSYQKAEEAN